MVRLKDYEVVIQKDGKEISIPYGAIKRKRRCCCYLRCYIISIPYGAIKSIYLKTAFFISTIFQFLMVRLKVANLYITL